MNPADRYSKLLRKAHGKFREALVPDIAAGLTELELQAHWFAGDFGTEFTTARGEKITVAQFGEWNREAGPDFAEAAVCINGGEPVRGAIEIDPEALDWERHGHGANPDYDSVVLHVCLRQEGKEFFTRTSRHREVPRIRIDATALNGTATALPVAKPGRCSAPLRGLDEVKVREVLEGAAQFRLKKKAARLARIAALHGEDAALYQALAVTLGYKKNKTPFTVIAQRFPLGYLRKKKDDLDAILFGATGFLDAADFTAYDLETRVYLRNLWDRWWKLRDALAPLTLAEGSWKLGSTRPANHPQRRVAALGEIVRHWQKISSLVKDGEVSTIREFLEGLSDEYWDYHYTLTSKKAPKRMALLGETRINDMLANVIYPLVVTAQPIRWKEYMRLPAADASKRVKVAALRLLGNNAEAKTILKSAAMQQGLLQIYEDFCMRDNSDCAQCVFPEQVAKW